VAQLLRGLRNVKTRFDYLDTIWTYIEGSSVAVLVPIDVEALCISLA